MLGWDVAGFADIQATALKAAISGSIFAVPEACFVMTMATEQAGLMERLFAALRNLLAPAARCLPVRAHDGPVHTGRRIQGRYGMAPTYVGGGWKWAYPGFGWGGPWRRSVAFRQHMCARAASWNGRWPTARRSYRWQGRGCGSVTIFHVRWRAPVVMLLLRRILEFNDDDVPRRLAHVRPDVGMLLRPYCVSGFEFTSPSLKRRLGAPVRNLP
jgi:hypothetical protein